jgi:hypothetical protein
VDNVNRNVGFITKIAPLLSPWEWVVPLGVKKRRQSHIDRRNQLGL